jgi:regulatory helix-turn-helix LysR family protein
MHMHQVRYFLALCEEHSFTRAARRCGVAQPSLTRAVKLLEEELGGKLFDRHLRETRLTELGNLVRPDVAQIEKSAAVAKRKAEKFLITRSVTRQHKAMEALMRTHHVIAALVVLIVGLGAKEFLFSVTTAEADLRAASGINTIQMHLDHRTTEFPVQKMHDMTFVYSEGD